MSACVDLSGRSALVTGAGSGLGRAVAEQLGAAGARVVVVDRDEAAAEESVARIRRDGADALLVPADVTRSDEMARAVARCVAEHGALDLAVNGAAVRPDTRPLHEMDEDGFWSVLQVDLLGVALSLKHQLAQMVGQGHGAVVNVGSVQSFTAGPDKPAYAAAKHGVVALTESAAAAYGGRGVRVNAVCPGAMETAMVAESRAGSGLGEEEYRHRVGGVVGRIADPHEVAAAVLWLLSEHASYVTGHCLVADGGRLLRHGA